MTTNPDAPAVGGQELYHRTIVDTARAAFGAGTLEGADGSATVDNPLCGDRVAFDVVVEKHRIVRLAHRVRGCLLCEASAAVIGARASGSTREEVRAVRRQVDSLLAGEASEFRPDWADLTMFTPVRDYRSRHECVTLAFDALDAALSAAEAG